MAAAFRDAVGIFVVLLCLMSLSAYAAAVAWWLVRVDCRAAADWRFAVQETVLRAVGWCREAMFTKPKRELSPTDVAVYKLVEERKREFMRRGLFALAPIFALGNVFLLCRAAGWLPLQTWGLNEAALLGLTVIPSFAALCAVRTEQPTKEIMVAAHIIGYISLLWNLFEIEDGLFMFFDRSSSMATRIGYALTLCDIRLTAFCNFAYFVAMVYVFNDYASNEESIAQLDGNVFIYQELVVFFGIVVLHLVMQWRLEREARSTIEAKASNDFISGLTKLLKASYDVVVEVNDELILTGESKDLGAALLHCPVRSLEGTLFTDLMEHDEDKQEFAAHVTKSSIDTQAQCYAIPHNFRMRDSCSNLLYMEMWHTRLENLDSQARHLIGIKERVNDEHTVSRRSSGGNARRHIPPSPQRSQSSGVTNSSQGEASGRRPNALSPAASDEEQPRQGQVGGEQQQQCASVQAARPQGQQAGEASGCSSPSPTHSETHKRYMVEGLTRTSAWAQRVSMLRTLSEWNIAVRPVACCTYHELIGEAKHTLKGLARADCVPFHSQFSSAEMWQCTNCGIITSSPEAARYDPIAGTCYICQVDEPVVPGRTSL